MTEPVQRCGVVALAGKPNVGKSTLLNRLVGRSLSITSGRPQTTSHQLRGIRTEGAVQIIYTDTPGISLHGRHPRSRQLNQVALEALEHIDLVLFVVAALHWDEADRYALRQLRPGPWMLVINKADLVRPRSLLLPHIQELSGRLDCLEVIPVSAATGANVRHLELELTRRLPEAPHLFPDHQWTDRQEDFLIMERVREKLLRQLRLELPYQMTVQVENLRREGGLMHVDAVIWVEQSRHKAIVIGAGGRQLQKIGRAARLDLERLLSCRMMLCLRVRHRPVVASRKNAGTGEA